MSDIQPSTIEADLMAFVKKQHDAAQIAMNKALTEAGIPIEYHAMMRLVIRSTIAFAVDQAEEKQLFIKQLQQGSK